MQRGIMAEIRNNCRDKIIPFLPIKMQKNVDWILSWYVMTGVMPLHASGGTGSLPQ